MKSIKIIITIVVVLILGLYGYYSFLSYNIYKEIAKYERTGNTMAVDFSKKVIIKKYPYSIYYFVVKK